MQDLFLQILIWCGVLAALFGAAALFQRKYQSQKKVSAAHKITIIGVCSALGALLMFLEIPLFFAPSFYKIDLSEIPVLICSFSLGPVSGLTAEALKLVLKLLLKGTTTAFVGEFANFIVGAALILPASMLYHMHKSRKSALWGMIAGGISMTVFGSFLNAFYLIPAFSKIYGIPLDSIIQMGSAVNPLIQNLQTLVLFAVVPFNLIKAAIDGLLTFLLYKRVERLFFRQ